MSNSISMNHGDPIQMRGELISMINSARLQKFDKDFFKEMVDEVIDVFVSGGRTAHGRTQGILHSLHGCLIGYVGILENANGLEKTDYAENAAELVRRAHMELMRAQRSSMFKAAVVVLDDLRGQMAELQEEAQLDALLQSVAA